MVIEFYSPCALKVRNNAKITDTHTSSLWNFTIEISRRQVICRSIFTDPITSDRFPVGSNRFGWICRYSKRGREWAKRGFQGSLSSKASILPDEKGKNPHQFGGKTLIIHQMHRQNCPKIAANFHQTAILPN